MKIALAVREVRDAETRLVEGLDRIGERHRADHDIFHMSRTLMRIHDANLDALAPFGERYGTDEASEPVGDRFEGDLLRDLRALHLLYAEASIDWVILRQGAQAIRDSELLEPSTAVTPRRCAASSGR
jgi:hypothetical protein